MNIYNALSFAFGFFGTMIVGFSSIKSTLNWKKTKEEVISDSFMRVGGTDEENENDFLVKSKFFSIRSEAFGTLLIGVSVILQVFN